MSQGEFCKGTLSPGIGLAVTGKTGVAGQSGFLGRRNFSMVCIYLVGLGPDVHSVFLVVALALFFVCGGSLLFGCCQKSLVNVVCLLGLSFFCMASLVVFKVFSLGTTIQRRMSCKLCFTRCFSRFRHTLMWSECR